MACRLGLKVIVEGIETEEQAAYFRVACQGALGQGWLYGRPVPAGELIAVVAARGVGINDPVVDRSAERSK
jgi:sensor c-di-GMP phosphodiesterase-like protein